MAGDTDEPVVPARRHGPVFLPPESGAEQGQEEAHHRYRLYYPGRDADDFPADVSLAIVVHHCLLPPGVRHVGSAENTRQSHFRGRHPGHPCLRILPDCQMVGQKVPGGEANHFHIGLQESIPKERRYPVRGIARFGSLGGLPQRPDL